MILLPLLLLIDRSFLNFFETINRFIERLTGKNNVWTGWTLFCFLVGYMLISEYIITLGFSESDAIFNMLIAIGLCMMVQKMSNDLLRKYASVDMPSDRYPCNPLRTTRPVIALRLWCLIGIIFFTANATTLLSFRGLPPLFIGTSMAYTFSCTPLRSRKK